MPCRELLCHCSCNIYACWPSVTVTNTAAVQPCLLVGGCLLDCGHSISMSADLLSLNIACLLALCFSICYTCLTISRVCWYDVSLSSVPTGMVLHIGHTFWFGTSLSAMSVGVVPHYRSCVLVWCLTVGNVLWCGASLYAMPVGVVPHYRPCLLVRFSLQPIF